MKFVSFAASSKDFLNTVKLGVLPTTIISETPKPVATDVAIRATTSPTKFTIPAARSSLEASREDLAAGIVNLVGEVVARIATSVATGFGVSDIIVVGRTPNFTVLRKSLEDAAKLTNFTPHFPENAEYASALGAMLVAEKTPLAKN